MKKNLIFLLFASLLIIMSCSNKRNGKPKVLIFTKTVGFVHSSIPNGVEAIQKLGNENNFVVDTTSNSLNFNDENLKKYAAVIFLSTTGNVLDYNQEAAFERYIQSGGGFVGVHAACDTEYDWNWYGKLVGAYFLSHPKQQEADFIIKDDSVAATSFFTDSIWTRKDELYNFKKINPDVNVLIEIDENSYTGGENGDFHPMSWYHEYDGGKSFYTALGHTKESFKEEKYLKHLLGGIQYAIGDNNKLNYKKATSQLPPDPKRFTKKMLSEGTFFEPTEMTILPNLDVLITQRRGEIMHYNNETKELKQVALLNAYYKTNSDANAEEGVMGIQKDPNFSKNNWLYIYYSPAGDEWVNRLSRFTFKDGIFDLASEVIILDVESQREICCHTGGSIAFGPDGVLYLSTGDNSTPFNEKNVKYVNSGFAPLNDISGHESYDARRSSANTNDLRGKILKIIPNDDGSYDIPEGNLFPVGTDKTRPEIYTMGHRNPYRISVDPKKGYVYWGDVGPDAESDSLKTRGPRGYDEINQARKAGNYGWPLFIGDNFAYLDFDYETGKSGVMFDANNPINDSRNNTGLRELPPAKPAMIYYPYGKSSEFPQTETGGRNAMAGPVYYSDMYPFETALPNYYNEKVFIYEWMRGWIKAVSLFPNGDFNKMEPFAQNIDMNNVIDMEVAHNGQIYLLEYGTGWFQRNDDSGLSVIEFNGGNLPPEVSEITIDKITGSLPLDVNASVEASDVESKELSYSWTLGNGDLVETKVPSITYTYNEVGEFKMQVSVKDSDGNSTESKLVTIVAGNERPIVSVEILSGNKTFFIPGKEIEYNVTVEDANSSSEIDMANVYVSVDYLEGMDEVNMDQGHKQMAASVTGKMLTQTMDCKACHKEDEKSIGPSYIQVSEKYKDDTNVEEYLTKKIKSGGAGVWGEVAMAAHPDMSNEDLRQIIEYITSLTRIKTEKKSLPAKGTIMPEVAKMGKSLVITASYTDKGEENVKPLTGTSRTILQSNIVTFESNVTVDGFRSFNYEGLELLILPADKGWFALNNIDLLNVQSATIMARWQGEMPFGLNFQVRLDDPEGNLIGEGKMAKPLAGQNMGSIPIKLKPIVDGKKHDIYFTYKSIDASKSIMGGLIMVQFN